MNSRTKITMLVLTLALLAGGGVWFWRSKLEGAASSQLNLASLFAREESETFKLLNTYTNENYKFSFNYPEGIKIDEFDDENGRVILVGDKFQVFVTAFDESGPITAARIRQDLPEMAMENPTETKVAGQKALSFIGAGNDFKTAEVWFVWPPEPYPHGNYLYQVTSPADFDAELSKIMATFTFE